jgi:hypothetical protein
MLTKIKGFGKAYSNYQKARKAEKLANAPKTEEGKLLDKQVKILKKVAVGVPTILGGATIVGKIKQNNKDKKREEDYKKKVKE